MGFDVDAVWLCVWLHSDKISLHLERCIKATGMRSDEIISRSLAHNIHLYYRPLE